MPATVVAVAVAVVAVLHLVLASTEIAVVVVDAVAVAFVVERDGVEHFATSDTECFALPTEKMMTQWD